MARTKGMLNLSGNLEVNAGAPLDARSVVPTVADLTVAANFQYKYIGMTVVVQATGDMYILTANDVTVAANWKQVGSGGGGSSYTAGDGIDITNNVISVDEMASADMAEIVTPLPSVQARLPRYSTEEQVVGYWIDGKPIYQKTVIMVIADGEHSHNIENIDTVVGAEIIGINSSTHASKPIPYVNTTETSYGIQIEDITRTKIIIFTPAIDWSSYTGYFTLKYTKTTD